MHTSTIAAIATPGGAGGIGIIKISGKDAISIASLIFRKSGSSFDGAHAFESHRLYHGHIVHPESDKILDEVLLSVMKMPRSYTREDVVEINTHSGFAVLSGILELVLAKGARLAEPGEFTKRAFLNGRIDLTQAEGVIDIINARTEKALEIAGVQIKGELGKTIRSIRDTLLAVEAEIEAEIDFPDDVEELSSKDRHIETLQQAVISPLTALLNRYHIAHFFRDGIRMAVVGRPNVGKSSLVNRLIQKDRVIVTPIPGTTRDLIEETADIRGIPVVITDTAGLHQTDDPVEVIGIQKTQEYIKDSDLVLFLVDAGCPLTEADFEIRSILKGKNVVLVINKMDLLSEQRGFPIPESWRMPSVMISALYNQGVDALKALIARGFIRNGSESDGGRIVPNLRHKLTLERSVQASESALSGLQKDSHMELTAIDLKEAVDALGEIIGLTAKEAILDEIFSRFCIGK